MSVDRHPALIANQPPSIAGVSEKDNVTEPASAGKVPAGKRVSSGTGDCSGALRFDLALAAGETNTLGFIWAIAEMWLLLRDCLVYEDGDRLVLLAGVPPEWFTHGEPMVIENLP